MNSIHYKGNQRLVNEDVIALFCSREIPLSIYYPLLEFFEILFNEPVTVASGWHSTIEKKALELRKPLSASNVIYYLAKGIDQFEIPEKLQADFDRRKLLIVPPKSSPCDFSIRFLRQRRMRL